MPMNPNIALSAVGGGQQRPFDPFATLGDLAQLQNYRALMEERQAQARQREHELMVQQQIEALAQQHGDDPDAFVSGLSRIDPMLAAKYSTQLEEQRKTAAQAKSEEVKQSLAFLEAGTQLIQGATPDNYGARRQFVLRMSPQLETLLPEQYDETAINSLLQVGQSTKDFLEGQRKGAELFAEGKYQQGIGTAFATAATPQQWAIVQDSVKQAGLSRLLPLFGEYSPENVARARSLALGPKAEEDLARQALTQAETARHNRATEATAQGQLAVSRGQLSVAQGNLKVAQGNLEARQAEAKAGGKDGKGGMTPSMKAGISRLKGTLAQLQALDSKLTQQSGVLGKVSGTMQSWVAATGEDENATVYQGLSDSLLPALARASGEVGNLAEKEQERYGRLAPKVTDPLNVRRKKMQAIAGLVQAAEAGASADQMAPLLDYEKAVGTATGAGEGTKIGRFTVKVKGQ